MKASLERLAHLIKVGLPNSDKSKLKIKNRERNKKGILVTLAFIVFRYVYGTGPLNQFHDPLIRTVSS
jgi:hypothetical protein